ncbi:MAG: hypothetical protein AAB627_00045 [Patescibacteria group bacterium]
MERTEKPQVQQALLGQESEHGRVKIQLLKGRVIAPKYSEAGAMHRTTWEALLRLGNFGSAVFAERMRMAKGGRHTANQLEGMSGSYLLNFCVAQVAALEEKFSNYNSEFGFDIDVFLAVGSIFDHTKIQVYYEVFPRIFQHRVSTSFASSIYGLKPFRVAEEEIGGPGKIVMPIIGLLMGDEGSRGVMTEDLAQRVSDWHQRTMGVWPVYGDWHINFFLNRTLSSVILSEETETLAASVRRVFTGECSDAKLGKLRLVH